MFSGCSELAVHDGPDSHITSRFTQISLFGTRVATSGTGDCQSRKQAITPKLRAVGSPKRVILSSTAECSALTAPKGSAPFKCARFVCARSSWNSRADAQLQKLRLSDPSSDWDESTDDGEGNHNRRERSKRGKKPRSGETAKLTSKVLHPQIWPHSELRFLYVSKEVTYDNLTLAEFAVGYASILRLLKLSAPEQTARIEHFATLMYLATQFPWRLVRSLHAAALFETECGRLRWGDSFSHLEARLLHGPSNQSRSSTATTPKPAVQFCKAYQSGKCSFTKDHFGLIKNERKWVQHICAKCWLTKQDVQRHRENSAECPFTVSPPPTSSPVGPSNVWLAGASRVSSDQTIFPCSSLVPASCFPCSTVPVSSCVCMRQFTNSFSLRFFIGSVRRSCSSSSFRCFSSSFVRLNWQGCLRSSRSKCTGVYQCFGSSSSIARFQCPCSGFRYRIQ